MPSRKIILANDQIYHTFNRGVARLPIFTSIKHYSRFLQLINYYRFANTPVSYSQLTKLSLETRQQILDKLQKENSTQVEILAFCLMDNHYHLLLRQILDKGIVNFMANVQNSYVKYLNINEGRIGPLFQSAFKAKRIETNEQLLHVSRYIHLNPCTSFVVKIDNLAEYQWSSLPDYLNVNTPKHIFINSEPVLGQFKNKSSYKEFVYDQAEYQQELSLIKHLTFE